MIYETLRHFADSWGLMFMAFLWIAFTLWAFRPSAKSMHDDAANRSFDDPEMGNKKDV